MLAEMEACRAAFIRPANMRMQVAGDLTNEASTLYTSLNDVVTFADPLVALGKTPPAEGRVAEEAPPPPSTAHTSNLKQRPREEV